MQWPNDLRDRLKQTADRTQLEHVDIAAGDEVAVQLRLEHTGPPSTRPASPQHSQMGERADRRYLIASITKPIVSQLTVQMAADGAFSLNAHVREFLESFSRGPLRNITIRHLLTHTSGLPDMLPNNNELRCQHATQSDFVHQTSMVSPDFAAGTNCRYSSMGFAVLAAIIEQVSGQPLKTLARDRLFSPLGMNSSWLGLPEDQADKLMPTVLPCSLPLWQSNGTDWNWNSRYWRTMGASWGGMISTAEDLGQFAIMILNDGRSPSGDAVLSSAAVNAGTRNQTRHMGLLPESDRKHRPWGMGWRFNWLDHSSCFSDFLPPSAIGHWGATGTLLWIDRRSKRWCVILTTQPYEQSQGAIQRLSNIVASATLR